jgi:uncharacterized protein (TIGR00290 family)
MTSALPRVILSWSGGKDSSLALFEIKRARELEIVALLTTMTRDYGRVSMHGVRRSLIEQQAESIGLPLKISWINKGAGNAEYEKEMISLLEKSKKEGVARIAFGDLFLRDIREYRERYLRPIDMKCEFPLWGRNTTMLADRFIDLGFKAIVCTVDPRHIQGEFCGREFDRQFLSEIPKTVDPCGENGEFHTFVYKGPIFKRPIPVKVGEVVKRGEFYFADILPA